MAANEGNHKRPLEEEDPIVSLADVLEEDEQLESEACAVLGGSDSDKCSYSDGYVKRQALYACNTCTPKGGQPAGICLACSYKCHEGHELFELYTKRNFRCDCGNSKFNNLQCKFFSEKEKANYGNKYNDNFFGLYCVCKRPYPDPEDETPDEMIQCVVCEDWFHGRHLGATLPDNEEYQEMVCRSCMKRCSFLWAYATHVAVTKASDVENSGSLTKVEDGTVDVCSIRENGDVHNQNAMTNETKSDETAAKHNEPSTSYKVEEKSEGASGDDASCSVKEENVTENTGCKLQQVKKKGELQRDCATYWPHNWRNKLCTCQSCMNLYNELEISFLLDEFDTVLAYENKGKTVEETEREKCDPLMTALSNMNRIQQVELIYEYNDLKSELKDYLKRFADEGKVVTSEDIQHFFEELQSKKRRRVDGMQYFCS
ncbi:putative E3 ubiquitin-protein ligase UBR7 [Hemiscyllium ocellatum]|uniref:putative E3 ubiquitin-protein ligase UBR7 n=1 Tax=Hemiscyllium ocellatum TaxID=170820 RepID=UPI002966E5A0|nr:putative E3 ubiquitin-protein ligase UBR7 [Hemiscyllium ocellatum]